MTASKKSKRKRTPPVAVGDIFCFPVADNGYGLIQVIVKKYYTFYCAVFEPMFDAIPPLERICDYEVLLVAWTTDGEIYHGVWQKVGNQEPNLQQIPFPPYTVLSNGVPTVMDFFGQPIRAASKDDISALGNMSSYTPPAL